MAQTSVKDEIISRLDGFTLEELERVLQLVQTISTSHLPPAKPVENLLKYVGSIPADDLQAMSAAIEECERVDPSE